MNLEGCDLHQRLAGAIRKGAAHQTLSSATEYYPKGTSQVRERLKIGKTISKIPGLSTVFLFTRYDLNQRRT